MNITFSVNFAGAPDTDDIRAAKQIIFLENQRLSATGQPVTLLLMDTPANIKASYLSLILKTINNLHNQNITTATDTNATITRFTPDQLQTIHSNLIDQLNSGASIASIIAKTV